MMYAWDVLHLKVTFYLKYSYPIMSHINKVVFTCARNAKKTGRNPVAKFRIWMIPRDVNAVCGSR